MQSVFCTGLLFLMYYASFAQRISLSDSTTVFIGGQVHTGSILPHSGSIAHLTDSYLWGFQADISRIRHTQKAWNTCNCYSQNGISVSYYNFNKPDVLGGAFNVALFAEPQLTYGRVNLAFRAGAGISYVTKVYDPVDNPENLFFSSPWSGLLFVQLSGRLKINSAWMLRLNGSYNHISNGGKRQPNKGMNFPTAGVGIEYALKYAPLARRNKNPLVDKSVNYYAGLFYNTRAVDESDFSSRERKMVIGLQGGLYKPFARMHAAGLGFEFTHDRALRARARQEKEPFDHHVISGLIRHHFLFGRFDFSQALGIYLHKEYPTPSPVFQRYVLQYMVFEKLQIGFSLKAHLHTAEQMDVRAGFVF
jgi:hypothetical protein